MSLNAPDPSVDFSEARRRAEFVRDAMPKEGLFAGMSWRVSPEPFPLSAEQVQELEWLGRVSLQFYKAVNQLYRWSVEAPTSRRCAGASSAGSTTPGGVITWI